MKNDSGKHGSYLRFLAMVGTSTVVMYALMYLNTYQLPEHVRYSETRVFMALIMGGAMAIIMLLFMRGMYKDKKTNAAIFAGGALLVLLSLWLVRSQATVTDVDYMRAMVPHHSIAILTSDRAGIEDVRVRELADEIIEAQRREISEMDWLVDDIRANGLATTEEEANSRPVPDFSGASE